MSQRTRDEADTKMPKIVMSGWVGSAQWVSHGLAGDEENDDCTRRVVQVRC